MFNHLEHIPIKVTGDSGASFKAEILWLEHWLDNDDTWLLQSVCGVCMALHMHYSDVVLSTMLCNEDIIISILQLRLSGSGLPKTIWRARNRDGIPILTSAGTDGLHDPCCIQHWE